MAKKLNHVFARIRKLAAVQTARACGDAELLERFVAAGDEAAFTLLVERHGPMVLGLCRRVLRHAQDADDACQAAFLVLARKAGSLRRRASLASWLHGVAYRISVNLRRALARRRRREQQAEPRPSRDTADVSWRELHAILDEELQRLPERYRAPLVLCYLDGKTRDEAARELGSSPGALHGLLERGRKLLRDRLTQRGVTLPAALVVTALSAPAAKAVLPPAFVIACTRAALVVANGQPLAQGLIAPHILSLAQEATKVMFATKVKIGTAVLVGAGLLTVLIGGALTPASRAQDPGYYPPALALVVRGAKGENDEDFIRRVSKDLRGVDPSPAELHFFLASKDANKRQKVIDLFIQERQAKQAAPARKEAETLRYTLGEAQVWPMEVRPTPSITPWVRVSEVPAWQWSVRAQRYPALQEGFYKQLLAAAKEKKDVAAITQNHLDRLMEYVKKNPKAEDIPDAMLQISVIYRSQGKTVEADAWREKLRKEHPKSSAAKTAQDTPSQERRGWSADDMLAPLRVWSVDTQGRWQVVPNEEKKE